MHDSIKAVARRISFLVLAVAVSTLLPSQAAHAAFANGGFENGSANAAPPSWTINTHLNYGITIQTPQTYAGLNLLAGGVANTVIVNSAVGPDTQPDPAVGAAASLRWPRYGKQSVVVNGPSSSATNTTGANDNVNEMSQTMTVGAADVDPVDGQIHVRFVLAPVMQNPAHTAVQQPYVFVLVTNVTKGLTLYSQLIISGESSGPWQSMTVGGNTIDFTDWQLFDVSPGPFGVAIGDSIELQVLAAGCAEGSHWGEAYVDGVGSVIPGISVEATGPGQANAGDNVTYDLTYRNGSASAETNVVVDFTTPAQTTFQSVTPPAGVTCTSPAVGGTGTISCTFGSSLSPGASGSLSVVVAIDSSATGTITLGNYDIQSDQETKLLGPPVTATAGCSADSQCSAGQWCNESANACTAVLADGIPMPIDPKHTNPTLNGICTVPAATLVCMSGVCDTTSNECGYPVPVVNIAANPATITQGSSTTLTWSSTNATSCTASGAWSGTQATSGSATQTPAAIGNSTYTLTCTGEGESASGSATVTVNAGNLPTVTIAANPSTITQGSSTTLTWSSTLATSCTASGNWSGAKALNNATGLKVTPAGTGKKTYTLACSNTDGTTSSIASVTVNPPAPTISISFNQPNINIGDSSLLTWSTANATSCTANGAWSGTKSRSGSLVVAPKTAGTYTYGLSCSGSGGSTTSSATLTVNLPPPVVNFQIDGNSSESITLGASANLSWTSTYADSCSSSGTWSNEPRARNDPQVTLTPTVQGNRTYTLTCTNVTGSTSSTVTLTVNPPTAPTVSLLVDGASSDSITLGSSATLSWTSTYADSCSSSGTWSNEPRARSDPQVTVKPTKKSMYIYTLTCTNSVGSNSSSATLNVN